LRRAEPPCPSTPIAAPVAATNSKRSRTSPPSRKPSAPSAARPRSFAPSPLRASISKALDGTSTTTPPKALTHPLNHPAIPAPQNQSPPNPKKPPSQNRPSPATSRPPHPPLQPPPHLQVLLRQLV